MTIVDNQGNRYPEQEEVAMIDKETIEILTAVAFEQGPFFFSVFFMLVVVGMAHRCYRKVNMRTDPVASPEEKKCYKLYFLSSFVASLLLVFISVSWWMYAHVAKHTLRGVIIGISSDSQIFTESESMYLRKTEKTLSSDIRLTDYHFAIIRDDPFSQGQRFPIIFYPQGGYLGEGEPSPIPLYVEYSGKGYANYRIKKEGKRFTLAIEQ